MFNIKALSLTTGIVFALLALLSAILFGPLLSQTNVAEAMPQLNLGTGILAALATIVVAFIEGVIFGAIFGWIYNAFERQDVTNYSREDLGAYQA